jgi:integrase
MKTLVITGSIAEHLAPGQTVWDAKVGGFGVRRQRRNSAYFVKYRDLDGRQRWHTIAKHGAIDKQGRPWSADRARKEAKRVLGLVLDDRDPAAARDEAEAEPTLAEFCERYMAEYAAHHQKDRTRADHRDRLNRQILPVLRDLKLTEINRAHIAKLHAKLGPAGQVAANRAIDLLSAILNWAERVGERPDNSNPCRYVKRYPEKPRERLVTAEELARLGDVLADRKEDWRAVAAIQLLMFTGGRVSEILSLQWDWIYAGRGLARLPDSKTGAKSLYLPPPALAVLDELPRLNNSPFVLPGDRAGGHFIGLSHPWQRIRKVAGLDDVRLHDLRHLVASVAVASGDSLYIVGKLLGHRVAATTARYSHLAPDPVLAVATRTAQRIDDMMRGGKPGRAA